MKAIIRWCNQLKSGSRLLICFGVAAIVLAAMIYARIEILTSITLAWDSFCLMLIALSWLNFYTVPQPELSKNAQAEDESRSITFFLVLCSVCISLVAIVVLMKNADESLIRKNLHRAVSLLGVGLSWILLHTVFTLRYAHLYYADGPHDTAPGPGGLSFPNDDAPDYMDFAYFSFVLGMTFQVSDVDITSKVIRRIALLHSFIAFVFNTTIVALTISIVSNLGK